MISMFKGYIMMATGIILGSVWSVGVVNVAVDMSDLAHGVLNVWLCIDAVIILAVSVAATVNRALGRRGA